MDSEGTVTFCEELRQKLQEMGWDIGTTDILTIPVTVDGSIKQYNLLINYGSGGWGAQSPDQKKLVALAAQIIEIKRGMMTAVKMVSIMNLH